MKLSAFQLRRKGRRSGWNKPRPADLLLQQKVGTAPTVTFYNPMSVEDVYRNNRYQTQPIPAPKYYSWHDYLSRVSDKEIRTWCGKKATAANQPRKIMAWKFGTRLLTWQEAKNERLHLNDATDTEDIYVIVQPKLTVEMVYDVLCEAEGRCYLCNSLCVETKTREGSFKDRSRRIGSLEHKIPVKAGGTNARSNLAWCCMACQNGSLYPWDYPNRNGGYYPGRDMISDLEALINTSWETSSPLDKNSICQHWPDESCPDIPSQYPGWHIRLF
jgi:hypothetical protein